METPEEIGPARPGAVHHDDPGLLAARRRIADLEQQLVQARHALEAFTYSVSHDLRAPLRHVSAYLKIIGEDLGDTVEPAIASHLQTASDAASRMARMMDALLELSRIGRAELQLSTIDLTGLLSELRDKLAPTTGARVITWHIAPDLPQVCGDLALLSQMFLHLLANAVKFTRANPAPVIEIGWCMLDDNRCELHVQDNGAGFDPRFADRLFRVFQRLHGERQFEGLGLGLALARLVVERHGGRIQARSEIGAGCRVSLTLPLAPGAAAEGPAHQTCSA